MTSQHQEVRYKTSLPKPMAYPSVIFKVFLLLREVFPARDS
jgi:hypothetical protein